MQLWSGSLTYLVLVSHLAPRMFTIKTSPPHCWALNYTRFTAVYLSHPTYPRAGQEQTEDDPTSIERVSGWLQLFPHTLEHVIVFHSNTSRGPWLSPTFKQLGILASYCLVPRLWFLTGAQNGRQINHIEHQARRLSAHFNPPTTAGRT